MNPFAVSLSAVAEAFDRLRISYLIGGSLASAAWGVLRATIDVDILARIHETHADAFAAALGPDWYADPEMIRSSIRAGRSFNLIHRISGQKFDIFPATAEFHTSELQRASMVPLDLIGASQTFPVATAEDILVAKLEWYAPGNEVSERQWSDITGILTSNPGLDLDYVQTWARRLRVDRLLARALEQLGRSQCNT